ncbi:MAG: tRNA (adenosine(37)-N6)-threonylcarbamoyltransferase complex transferase subunit TsaD [bacterium]|nr:tRNA (adenosine(37)-N6)-threonylcarbamoyltransferase complex transferase subunit TsaD [bacterium]
MNKQKIAIILAIESSCDDSAASIISADQKTGRIRVLSNIISSQIAIHKKYGGVVPEIAAREHVLNLLPVINEALIKAKVLPKNLTAIAITKGPGLITSLIAGAETARALAFAWKKPLIEVNHIEGHIYANFINPTAPIKFPAVILTVSGGHTILLVMEKSGKIKIIGETRDDAAGEAYDKAAKMMGLGYPGGSIVSGLAAEYGKKTTNLKLPRPMLNSPDFDFSFSGLKTALLYELKKDPNWKNRIPEYCSDYQQAIIDVLIHKTLKAALKFKAKTTMLTGGVSANNELRAQMAEAVKTRTKNINFVIPAKDYTTDNAAMIATAAFYKLRKNKLISFKRLRVNASLELK